MIRWENFLKDGKESESHTRLANFIGIAFLGVTNIILACQGIADGFTAGALAGLCGANFVGAKMSQDKLDAVKAKVEAKNDTL